MLTKFSSDFAHKIPFGITKIKKKSRPTYPNFFGHVTGNKHIFLGLSAIELPVSHLPINATASRLPIVNTLMRIDEIGTDQIRTQ